MNKLGLITEKIKKHKKLTIVLIIVLSVAISGGAIASNMNMKKEQMMAMMNQTQTSKVERRTLVSSVSATGTLTSVNSKDVVVDLNGVEVKSVSVELGDMVEAGQILCEFNSEDIEENLAEAKTALNVATQKTQMDLNVAERNLEEAKEDYDTDLKRGNTDLGVAYNDYVEALDEVEEAETSWNEAKATTIEKKGELELREEQLSAKQAQLNAAGSSDTQAQNFTQKANELKNYAEQKSVTLNNSVMDKIGLGNDLSQIIIGTETTSDFQINNSSADADAQRAKIEEFMNELKSLQSSYNTSCQLEAECASLQQEVASWQSKYNTAKSNESSYEKAYEQAVSASESKLQAYDKQKRNLEDTTKNAENAVINKTESLTTAQLNALSSGNNEEDKVEQYQQQLNDCAVEAPMSGVISAVNIAEGDTYNGTAIVTIDDISSFEVNAQIDEYDIGKVEKGQKVVIKTNATGDEELEGTVKIVSPRASTGGNDITYTVIISVDTPSEMLRMDMTAKLSIILESKENVLTVPYEAVQEEESGKFYVEVVDDAIEGNQTSQEINAEQIAEGMGQKNMPQKPEGMDWDNMSGGMGEGNRPQRMNSDNNSKISNGSSEEASEVTTRRIYIEKGIESDYYIEIISDEVIEGMEVVVPNSGEENSRNIQNMMMGRGPMGGF